MIRDELINKIEDYSANVAILGLGYVGLPLAVVFAEAGFYVTGVDVDEKKVASLNKGVSYIQDVNSGQLERLVSSGRLRGTTDFSKITKADAVSFVCPHRYVKQEILICHLSSMSLLNWPTICIQA